MARQNDALANFSAATNSEVACSTVAAYLAALQTEYSPAFLMIQNVGTEPIYYRLTADASATACAITSGNYSGILAAGDTSEDGTGGVMTFAGYTGGISFITSSGTSTVNVAYSGRLGD